jgi:hypothetical protein
VAHSYNTIAAADVSSGYLSCLRYLRMNVSLSPMYLSAKEWNGAIDPTIKMAKYNAWDRVLFIILYL